MYWDFYSVSVERSERDGRIKNEDRTLIIAPKYRDYGFFKMCFKKELYWNRGKKRQQLTRNSPTPGTVFEA